MPLVHLVHVVVVVVVVVLVVVVPLVVVVVVVVAAAAAAVAAAAVALRVHVLACEFVPALGCLRQSSFSFYRASHLATRSCTTRSPRIAPECS